MTVNKTVVSPWRLQTSVRSKVTFQLLSKARIDRDSDCNSVFIGLDFGVGGQRRDGGFRPSSRVFCSSTGRNKIPMNVLNTPLLRYDWKSWRDTRVFNEIRNLIGGKFVSRCVAVLSFLSILAHQKFM